MLFPRRGYILSPFFLWLFIPYGEFFYTSFFPEGIYSITFLSMVIYPLRGNRQIAIYSFYGYLSPTGKFSIHLFSRREFISIEKHYKRCCFPVGDIFYHLSLYGYLSPTGNLLHIFFPGGNIYP